MGGSKGGREKGIYEGRERESGGGGEKLALIIFHASCYLVWGKFVTISILILCLLVNLTFQLGMMIVLFLETNPVVFIVFDDKLPKHQAHSTTRATKSKTEAPTPKGAQGES